MNRTLQTRIGSHIVYMSVYPDCETMIGPSATHFGTYLTAETLYPRAYFPMEPGLSMSDLLAAAVMIYEGQHDTEVDKLTATADCHHVRADA